MRAASRAEGEPRQRGAQARQVVASASSAGCPHPSQRVARTSSSKSPTPDCRPACARRQPHGAEEPGRSTPLRGAHAPPACFDRHPRLASPARAHAPPKPRPAPPSACAQREDFDAAAYISRLGHLGEQARAARSPRRRTLPPSLSPPTRRSAAPATAASAQDLRQAHRNLGALRQQSEDELQRAVLLNYGAFIRRAALQLPTAAGTRLHAPATAAPYAAATAFTPRLWRRRRCHRFFTRSCACPDAPAREQRGQGGGLP